MSIYLILIIFLYILWIFRGELHFIDMILLYCLFFDISVRFAGEQTINYQYLQSFIILIYIFLYLIRNWKDFDDKARSLLFYSFGFLLFTIMIPYFKGVSLNSSLRTFAINSQSILILPIVYHYYSTKGEINNLFKVVCYMTILWALAVIIFTLLKIDVIGTYANLGSQGFGIGYIYFGEMSNRGAISYISLLFICFPAILINIKGTLKSLWFISTIFIISIILISLKRFSLIAIGFGIVNFFLFSGIKLSKKYAYLGILILTIVLLLNFTPLPDLIIESYFRRGAENKISIESVQEDIRLYEPFYVFNDTMKNNISNFLFGPQTDIVFDVYSKTHYLPMRMIHNQYAQYMLIYGIIGLFLYIMIYIKLYLICLKYYKLIKYSSTIYAWYWVTFQNIILLFIIGGIAGGHVHPTYRTIVMIVCGGIAGYFKKQYYNKYITKNSII